MAVVGDAGSAGATEVEEPVAVPDKVAGAGQSGSAGRGGTRGGGSAGQVGSAGRGGSAGRSGLGQRRIDGCTGGNFLNIFRSHPAKSFLGCSSRCSLVVLVCFELFHIVTRYPHRVVFHVLNHLPNLHLVLRGLLRLAIFRRR